METDHDNSSTDTVGQEEGPTPACWRGCHDSQSDPDEEFSDRALPWSSCEPGSEALTVGVV